MKPMTHKACSSRRDALASPVAMLEGHPVGRKGLAKSRTIVYILHDSNHSVEHLNLIPVGLRL